MEKTFKGIDVSVWQGTINFNKVKLNGVDFVIIKAGGSDDDFYTDSCFEINYNNAKKAGLKIGCYYIVGSNFDTIEKGIKNAEHFAKIIKGKTFDYPIFLDLELTSPSQKYGATTASIAFCDYLINLGYYVGIYASAISGFEDRLDISRLGKYDKWVAQYDFEKPTYPPNCKIWQYSSTGKIEGINCNVDMNISYCDYPSIIKNSTNLTNVSTSVKDIQNWLNANYKADLTVDGILSDLTEKALVKALQTELNKQYNSNLDTDGIFGDKTKTEILNIFNDTKDSITKILQGLVICNEYSANISTSVNSDIESVQKWLNVNYKSDLIVDGIFGDLTKKALVKALQTELNKQYNSNLAIDGIFGEKTKTEIPEVSFGASGNITKILQGLLICNGYTLNGFDGIFGSGTECAVISYQSNQSLSIDGIAGEETFFSLCK
jgi:GH25 family lysozyme M1 (1,4-beta-N-acetylmuramidase)